MKLTLTVGGGATGLAKEHSIDMGSLDQHTHDALLEYINASGPLRPSNFYESWALNDGKEVPIDRTRMNAALIRLYEEMKKKLSYIRPS